MTSSQNLTNYILNFFSNKGDLITNKKLQKLLYYAEAWYLVFKKKPLLKDNFEAWAHGPVLPEIYHRYKKFGWEPIDLDAIVKEDGTLKKSDKEIIDEVLIKYGNFSAGYLELLTHESAPWANVFSKFARNNNCSEPIQKKEIQKYYTKLLKSKSKKK